MRFNRMVNTIRSSLSNLSKAIDGLVSMSEDLDDVFHSLFDNKVPDLWHSVSYPSLKPLTGWIKDFIERLEFI